MERRSLEGLPYVSFVASGFSRMGFVPVREPIRLTASAEAPVVRRSFMRRRKADATYAYLVASAFGWIASRVRDALMAAVALALAFALIGCGKKGSCTAMPGRI